MDIKEIKTILEAITKELGTIKDTKAVLIIKTSLNLVENLVAANEALQKTVQSLKNEINRLKGEQGKPNFSGKKPKRDISSRKNLKKKKKKKFKKKKVGTIKIDREMVCKVDKTELPDDAIFKGYQETVVQDIVVKTDNINFKKEVYYSPSLKKTFIGKVPAGYEGEFGPGVKSHILNLSHDPLVTQPALKRLLETFGISIGAGTISRKITDDLDTFHEEKKAIVEAGLQSTIYQHIDDTGCKVNGKNHYTHILCNPLYTAYFTMPKKNRLTVLSILNQRDFRFRIDNEALAIMEYMKLPNKYITYLSSLNSEKEYSRKEFRILLKQLFPGSKKKKRYRRIIIEASAISAFHAKERTIISIICDDAPQFKFLLDIALCWIHEGRHYKKLNPVVLLHREKLDEFLRNFWDYYEKLLEYKKSPSIEQKLILSDIFDNLFSTKTGYQQLDDRIASTLKNKNSLLLVLKYPELPLHNNLAELGARAQKRKGDASLQTKNVKGTRAKDTFMTIIQTARKLDVNTFEYIFDRITKKFEMPALADMIIQRATV